METVWQWGINVIVAIQQVHGPLLDGFFGAITFLGDEQFYLFLIPVMVWCLDFRFGVRLAAFFLMASYINVGLKDLFQHPRPFDLVPGVKLAAAEGYGLPSGHAQSATVVWGTLAARWRRTWLLGLAAALIVLIGFSRVYLGVHFPTDVLAGWAIGGILLVVYLAVQPGVERWASELSLWWQIILALAVPAVLVLVHPTKDTVTVMAPLCGAGLGFVLACRYVRFDAGGQWWQRLVRFLLGMVVVVALYLGLKVMFPGEGSGLYLLFRFLRYGLIGLWVTLGAPWLFSLLRLANTEKSA